MAVEHIIVVGAGQMGAGIAQVALHAGLQVTLVDVAEEGLKKGEISRLVVVHLPELGAGHGSPLPFPESRSLTLLRSRRAGKFGLSVYEL